MAASAILWPVAAHLLLVVVLYAWLTVERARAAARGEAEFADYRHGDAEPTRSRVIAANLRNQFELPVVFYVLAMTLFVLDAVDGAQLALAWVFIGGRIAHTGVQTLSANVRLRGGVFMINALAVWGMWLLFLARELLAPAGAGAA